MYSYVTMRQCNFNIFLQTGNNITNKYDLERSLY